MAIYFGQDEAIYPLLTVSDITDESQTAFRLSGATQGNLPVNEAKFLTVVPVQSELPSTSDPVSLYSVQTGADRGLYYNTGTDIVLIIAYPNDGTWPL